SSSTLNATICDFWAFGSFRAMATPRHVTIRMTSSYFRAPPAARRTPGAGASLALAALELDLGDRVVLVGRDLELRLPRGLLAPEDLVERADLAGLCGPVGVDEDDPGLVGDPVDCFLVSLLDRDLLLRRVVLEQGHLAGEHEPGGAQHAAQGEQQLPH